jgi:hypothetical protein
MQDSISLLCHNLRLSALLLHVLTFNIDRYQTNFLVLGRYTFRDRRPCTTACPGCWPMGTKELK